MKKHGEREKKCAKIKRLHRSRERSMILEVKIFSDVAGMGMQRAGWLFSYRERLRLREPDLKK
jgi:hypothetical protein